MSPIFSCPILYSIVYVTVWYFVGSLCHGSKPKSINGFRCITLAQDEQTGTKSSPRVYRISSMQNLNGLDQRIFKLSRKLFFLSIYYDIYWCCSSWLFHQKCLMSCSKNGPPLMMLSSSWLHRHFTYKQTITIRLSDAHQFPKAHFGKFMLHFLIVSMPVQ